MKDKVLKVLSVVLVFAMALSIANTSSVKVQAKQYKSVILYFSATGTTKGAAKRIKNKTKGKLIEIKASEPYTDDDLDYGNSESRVSKEHASASSPAESTVRPGIRNLAAIKKAVKKADFVYIGYPIWWGEAPHIVYNLVENVNLNGKRVVPFCTSASSGLGNSAINLKNSAKISSSGRTKTWWLDGRNFYNVPSQKTVNKWIEGIFRD